MLSPWLGILLVLTALSGVMACLKLVGARGGLHPETSRKAVHIAMGLVTLSFPWLFRANWPVLLLAVLAVAALAGTRLIMPLRDRFGGVLHGVERYSLGEVYFPLAVAALFLLSSGNSLLYVIPLLTLTLADAVAALVGMHYGRHRYATSEGTKSAEGSLAFFLVAFLSAQVPLLLLSDTGRVESLLIAMVLGILVMLFEAVSVGGFDNLFIPLGCYALLRRYLELGVDELLFRLGIIFLLALLVFCWRGRTTLKESGLLAAALVGYMNWTLGGWQWLAVSLVLFLTYTCLWPRSEDNDHPVHTVRAVASVAAPGMVWLLAMQQNNRMGGFLEPFILSYAAHSVMVGMSQLEHVKPDQSVPRRILAVVSRSWLIFAPLFFLPVVSVRRVEIFHISPEVSAALCAAILAIPLLLAAACLHQRLIRKYGDDERAYGRWLGRGAIAVGMSFLLFLLSGCGSFKEWKYRPASLAEKRSIHVASHGWHTGIILSRQDLGTELSFLNQYLPESPYYEFGWGEADFYQAEEITARLVLKALFWRNPTVMHVVAVPTTPGHYFNESELVELDLSETGMTHMRKSLRASFRFDENNRPSILKKGLYGESRFFKAEGYYFFTNTCNSWTAAILDNAGVPMDSLLTLRAGSVMSQAEDAKKRFGCCQGNYYGVTP